MERPLVAHVVIGGAAERAVVGRPVLAQLQLRVQLGPQQEQLLGEV